MAGNFSRFIFLGSFARSSRDRGNGEQGVGSRGAIALYVMIDGCYILLSLPVKLLLCLDMV